MNGKVLAALLGMLVAAPAAAETVRMTSLEWPPYSGAELPQQGAVIAVARAAFAAMGDELIVEFYPWSRAVKLVTTPGTGFVAYLPEYAYESEEFTFSEPLGYGPLGLVERSAEPVVWETIEDLERYRIGVVQGYVNTAAFDAAVAEERIQVETVVSDAQNARKVAAERLDAAVIDSHVLDYLLARDPLLEPVEPGAVRMNARLLESKALLAAFRNGPEGDRWRQTLNEGLKRIDAEAMLREYLMRDWSR
ncbi:MULTISPECIES: ABC transporter substrate-binding protein [Marichromatium]|uniref:Amino acid ABC transporter substrate-binding protein (PAAT family) n=1 Tax=Marichromatium gracile TaxID=1048 RepID=A0A4R4AGY5_MARGR|nr:MULTISPECIES: transporter substrate-binding domain-containing protein [Marichromatium]MBO8087278.1 transporter substrate-binding domain-containing protein [Marichromatium sp.]MBK1708334.1 ABC transporter [Marichromatium gracile]RNE91176.1 ABC transporter [Marichromatium sp. AB31]RNE93027.1 ABC transporter [Marichromatium sp. AB32]TCW38537.1 amino acid ABC transporter substrate-binding protein (PAAT family) [Marichromatium gracile]